MDQLQRKLKRKSEDLEELERQLCSRQTTERARLQPEMTELKNFRQAATKAANKRAVQIDRTNREDFEHPQNKKDALDPALYGMEAALRYNSAGSSRKALVLLTALIQRHHLQ